LREMSVGIISQKKIDWMFSFSFLNIYFDH
jgi:hypothetical protein